MWLWISLAYAACGPRPATPDGWRAAAACLEGEHQEAAAVVAWGHALPGELPADDPWATLASGDAAAASGDDARAAEIYVRVPLTSAAYRPAQLRAAVAFVRAGKNRSAVLAFREVSVRAPAPDALSDAAMIGIGAVYLMLGERGGEGRPPEYLFGLCGDYTGQVAEGGALFGLSRAVVAQARLRAGDRKEAIRLLQDAGRDVPEALPLSVALARDPAFTFAAESARWAEIRAALVAGEPRLDLAAVWGLGDPAPADPLAAELLAEVRARAVQARLARIDAALAAAEANVAGEARSSFEVRSMDFGG